MKKLLAMIALSLSLVQANDLINLSLVDFAQRVSKQTNKPIYIDEDVNASNVYLYVPDKINDKDIFRIFKNTLYKKDLTIVKTGQVYSVFKIKEKYKTFIYKLNYDTFQDCKQILDIYQVSYKYLAETNSIILRVKNELIEQVRNSLALIDKMSHQATIKLYIIEYSNKDIKEAGVEWSSIFKNVSGGVEYALNSIVVSNFTRASAIPAVNFHYALKLLQEKSYINVTQRPYVKIRNNKDFSFSSVDNIPYLVTTTTTDSTVNQEQNSIEYRDVGLKIKGKALIYDNYITLNLDLIVENILTNNNNMPTTTRRLLHSDVDLPFNSVILLSGIKIYKTIDRDYSIPYLSNIPYLGKVFEYKTADVEDVDVTIAIEVISTGAKATFVAGEERAGTKGR